MKLKKKKGREIMTREEQIREAARNLRISVSRANKATFAREVFEAGVKWADEHPKSPWISVEERLPETNEFDGSEDVLILTENGRMTVAMYGIPEEKWYLSVGEIQGDCECPFEITHWMPIPGLAERVNR